MSISRSVETEICAAESPGCIERAVDALRAGQLVILPTDTVYGVAADAGNFEAVRAIYAVKGRPADKPLQIFTASVKDAERVADLGTSGHQLAEAFLPGGLAIVARKAGGFESEALLGGDTVAIRIPASQATLALLRALGQPLAVTSANRSGAASPRTAQEAAEGLAGMVPLVLDGGPGAGIESTIVDISKEPPLLLRPGLIPVERIEQVLGAPVARPS